MSDQGPATEAATGGNQATAGDQAGGEIYDLGYRNYDGERLGRRAAFMSLLILSLRNTYGLGRGVFPKFIAFGLAAAAMLPAVISMMILILVGIDEGPRYDDFFGWVQVILVLFVAAMASDLVGNDRRHNILPLYFSRPVERDDYVLAKMAALTIGLLPLTLLPQLLLFVGNWLGADDTSEWLSDNISDLWPILVASVLVCAQLSAVGLAISMFTTRRAFALMAVLGGMLVAATIAGIVIETVDSRWATIAALLSPVTTTDGTVRVLFEGAIGGPDFDQRFYDLVDDTPKLLWIAAPLAHVALALGVALRRYRKTSL